MESKQMIDDHTANSATWNDRLENIAWGLFLIVVGIAWLGPGAEVPLGICLTGGGLIMLALNAVRYFTGIKTSSFTIGLGAIAILAGIASALSVKIFGVLLIVIGSAIILRPFFQKERSSGKIGPSGPTQAGVRGRESAPILNTQRIARPES
jgi:hypothetical protein